MYSIRKSLCLIFAALLITGAITRPEITQAQANSRQYRGLVSTAAVQVTPRLMPLGDSITRGSVDGFGYRDHLQDFLGINKWDFVGPFAHPASHATYDVDHAGVSGQTTAQIEARTLSHLTTYMVGNAANSIVLLHAGTNDVMTMPGTGTLEERIASYVANVEDIIEIIHAHDPTIRIFVALIVPNTDSTIEARIELYNSTLKTMLQNYQTTKSNLYIVDMHSAFVNNPDWATEWFHTDGVHPNDAGFRVMASKWSNAISHAILATPSALNAPPQRQLFTTFTPTLTWAGTSWAAAYEVEVDNQASFGSPEYRSPELSPEMLNNTILLQNNGTYYWRVRAKRPDGRWGAWSQPDSFVVIVS